MNVQHQPFNQQQMPGQVSVNAVDEKSANESWQAIGGAFAANVVLTCICINFGVQGNVNLIRLQAILQGLLYCVCLYGAYKVQTAPAGQTMEKTKVPCFTGVFCCIAFVCTARTRCRRHLQG